MIVKGLYTFLFYIGFLISPLFSSTILINIPVTPMKQKTLSVAYLIELFQLKAKWNGSYFSILRNFNGNIHAYVSGKTTNNTYIPQITDGFLTWYGNNFTVSGGKLVNRYRTSKLPYSTATGNSFAKNWLAWEGYGFAVGFEKKTKKGIISSALTLEHQKNTTFHTLYSVNFKRFQNNFLFSTLVFHQQKNNCLIFALEQFFHGRIIEFHSILKYSCFPYLVFKSPRVKSAKKSTKGNLSIRFNFASRK